MHIDLMIVLQRSYTSMVRRIKANCLDLSGISGGFGAAMVATVAVGVPFKTEMRWGRTKYCST